MKLISRRHAVHAMFACVMPAVAVAQDAQAYPHQPITLVVPFAAGGMTDILARQLGKTLQQEWQKPVVVDNRLGAGGIVGADRVAKSRADGYTLLITTTAHVVNPAINKKLPYDTVKDFQPVAMLARTPNVLVVNPANPARNLKELLEQARRKGGVSYGSSGTGGTTHLSGELLASRTGAPLLHVPYKGTALAINDLIGGQIDASFVDALSAVQFIRSGTLRPIAVSTRERSAALSDVPTIAEQGVPGYETEIFIGLYAPAGTPPAIVQQLNELARRSMAEPGFKAMLLDRGTTNAGMSAPEFKSYVGAELSKWQAIVTTAKIQPDPAH
ncbi:tripartite tricarboxylate transporter substrate binding protein [Comamonas sp. Tr-654]|uniref:Bug family tripartite tricarboxylate transporter substrate binding protein n=1 Tax=Comamonas sp. Tr-654 TaxID=2608341 RepID=UPI001423F7B3|nr:tripartite tricarboxylate transporter substrate binding protein [Comamonas sp. Tr-654]NIF85123.1 tripartite tricarboxylate transporter substrate binding protein [Comamonas sp. Tr-654]